MGPKGVLLNKSSKVQKKESSHFIVTPELPGVGGGGAIGTGGTLDFQLVGVCRAGGLKTGPCLKPLGARKIYPVLIYLTKDVHVHTLF